MLHAAKQCGCAKEIGMTKAGQPHYCEHGNLLVYVHGLKGGSERPRAASKPRKSPKRTQPKRDWSDARRKVEDEVVCRVCGGNQDVQAAHVIGRASDKPREWGPHAALYVEPDSIVPLCGEFSPMKCHPLYDQHQLDILEFLSPAEQVQAVKDAGSIESARRRTSPSSYCILESPSRSTTGGARA